MKLTKYFETTKTFYEAAKHFHRLP